MYICCAKIFSKVISFPVILLFFQFLENKHGDSGEFDAPSSNENDSDDDDVNRHSPGDDEAQDSPGPGMTPATFDPDVSKAHVIILCSKILFRDFDPQLPPNGGCEVEKNITK